MNAQLNAAYLTVGNFLPQPRHYDADAFRNRSVSVAFNQLLDAGLPENLVDRRKLLKQGGFIGCSHRGRLCHRAGHEHRLWAGSLLELFESAALTSAGLFASAWAGFVGDVLSWAHR